MVSLQLALGEIVSKTITLALQVLELPLLSVTVNVTELLPILTDSRTDLEERMKQVSKQISHFCDVYDSKVHIVSYSLASLPVRSFLSLLDGEGYVKSITTVGSPNK